MLHSIGGDLQMSLNKAGISKQIDAVQVCDLWEKAISKIFGAQVSEQTQAMYFKNGTLAVAVLSPVLAQEFRFKEEEIIKEINRGRSDKVRKIRFEI